MKVSNKALFVGVVCMASAVVLNAINHARADWYEVKDGVVYECTGIDEDTNHGICIDNTGKYKPHMYETVYVHDLINGEYVSYNNCSVLKKSVGDIVVFDKEAYCGGGEFFDSIRLIQQIATVE